MRIRSIKPQFFRDSKILDLPPLARLLYIGLWCCADREGRMEFDARELRTQVLPEETPKTVTGLFALLATAGLTLHYTVDGREYLVIPNFLKHQIPHHREQPSTSPGPAQGRAIPKQVEGRSVSRNGQEELSGVRGAVTKEPKPTSRSRAPVAVTGGFQNAWNAYPHHEQRSKRVAAWKLWVKAELEPLEANVRAHIEAARAGSDWTREGGRFVPGMQAWLNGRDFTELPVVKDDPMSGLGPAGRATAEAGLRWLERMKEQEAQHDER